MIHGQRKQQEPKLYVGQWRAGTAEFLFCPRCANLTPVSPVGKALALPRSRLLSRALNLSFFFFSLSQHLSPLGTTLWLKVWL